VVVVNAISTAIVRPGKKALSIFLGAWAVCALLGGLTVGFLADGIPDGIIFACMAGTGGGLLAALATRRWLRDPGKSESNAAA
jgi:hypothetical protein